MKEQTSVETLIGKNCSGSDAELAKMSRIVYLALCAGRKQRKAR